MTGQWQPSLKSVTDYFYRITTKSCHPRM